MVSQGNQHLHYFSLVQNQRNILQKLSRNVDFNHCATLFLHKNSADVGKWFLKQLIVLRIFSIKQRTLATVFITQPSGYQSEAVLCFHISGHDKYYGNLLWSVVVLTSTMVGLFSHSTAIFLSIYQGGVALTQMNGIIKEGQRRKLLQTGQNAICR